jgi:hypothetical protein
MALIGVAATALFAAPAMATSAAAQGATVREESNLRAQPVSASPVLARLPAGAAIDVLCWSRGEPTYGTDLYGSMWLYTSAGGWIHSNLVSPVSVAPCGGAVTPLPSSGATVAPLLPNGVSVPRLLPNGEYENCDAARAAGPTPLFRTSPGFGQHLDRDNDGLGCEADD